MEGNGTPRCLRMSQEEECNGYEDGFELRYVFRVEIIALPDLLEPHVSSGEFKLRCGFEVESVPPRDL